MTLKENISEFIKGILFSYSQIFFSNKIYFAIVLLVISFFDIYAGLSGFFSVIVSNGFAYIIGYDRNKISLGYYGFNSLLVGLGIGVYFEPSFLLFFILFLFAIFTLFLTVTSEGIIGKYALPYLSIPFLLSLWAITLASFEFNALGISQRGLYMYNDLYFIGGEPLVKIYEWWGNLPFFSSLRIYFISLGAIFFQYNIISGIIISIVMLFYSRISFSLSLIGFYSAFIFYNLIGSDIGDVTYTYIGFNYILTSIAIGGFFIVPSYRSYIWVVILIPLVAMLTISLSKVFSIINLSIYSLPFNIIVLIFLYSFKLRLKKPIKMTEVIFQQYSPEKNLYYYRNNVIRHKNDYLIPLKLPFWGDWTISQAHDGEHTHKDEWRHAWDFVIKDDEQNTFRNSGRFTKDYFCYNKAVLAPADGVVTQIVDGIFDNKIGDINIENNWGNTIVIKHAEQLYTKLNHLKLGSFRVSIGDNIKHGQVLASCGNSGRSPEPHLHFQVQTSPFVGSTTIDYPISYYINKKNKKFEFHSFDRPKLNDLVSNIEINNSLKNAFKLPVGKKIKLKCKKNNKTFDENWEIYIDIFNIPYIYHKKTKSSASFHNNGSVHIFNHFSGSKNSMLYYFFIALYKVQLGFYKDIILEDTFPIDLVIKKRNLFFFDFLAPFYNFFKAEYKIQYKEIDSEIDSSKIKLLSKLEVSFLNKKFKSMEFCISILNNKIESIEVIGKNILMEFEV